MAETENRVFNFEEWCTSNGLTKKTFQALQKEDIVTENLLSTLTEGDMATLGVTLGQRKALRTAIKNIQKNFTSQDSVAELQQALSNEVDDGCLNSSRKITLADIRNGAALADAGKHFHELFLSDSLQNQPPSSSLPTTHAEHFACLDPRLTLTIKAHKKKAAHITDFLTERTKKRRQSQKKELIVDTEQRLVVRTDDQHPYSGIRMEEWVAANCRLMNYLLQTGALPRQDVEFYLAHTVNVMEYAERYSWESVLDFDHQYRELQAEHSFPWGTYPPYMEAKMEPRAQRSMTALQQHAMPECKQFKARGHCTFGKTCKYRHTQSANAHNLSPPTRAPPAQHSQAVATSSEQFGPAKNAFPRH